MRSQGCRSPKNEPVQGNSKGNIHTTIYLNIDPENEMDIPIAINAKYQSIKVLFNNNTPKE